MGRAVRCGSRRPPSEAGKGRSSPWGGEVERTRMDMRTRNGITSAVLATAVVAAAPAAAQAHHVAGGSAQCTLVGNVPTITATARFESFADDNKPIRGEL